MENEEHTESQLRVLWVIYNNTKNSQGISKERLLNATYSFYRKPIYITTLDTILGQLERQEYILWREGVILISGTGSALARNTKTTRPELFLPSRSPRIPMRA